MGIVDVKNLNFDYANKNILKDISFDIAQGSVTALVGPNGAGKTTLLRCLTNLETPLSGNVIINGIPVCDRPREAHRHIGYLSDFFGLYEDLTVRQCLTYMAWCHKVPTGNLQEKIEAIAAEVEITKFLNEKAGTLSRGYRQRLGVGLSLVHDPKILLLDEPASGMDPEARIKLSELMIRLRQRGMTIIVSSHILAELEDYCTDMLVIRDGEIKSHVLLKDHQATTETVIHCHGNFTPEHIATLAAFTGLKDIRNEDGGLHFTLEGGQDRHAALLSHLVTQGVPIESFTPDKKTLKTVYMDLAAEKEDSKA